MLCGRGLLDRPELEAAHSLACLSARELLRTPNFGRTSLAALCAWLAGHGLKLREASPSNEGAPASQCDARRSRGRAMMGGAA
jgi:DNA-directed RNA polymerase alpha subunit